MEMEGNDVQKLYEYGERLTEAHDKAKHEKDYLGIIAAAAGTSKAKQLAAQLIPRFFMFFRKFSSQAINAHFDLCEEDELGIRVQAIRGLPLLCKDAPENSPKIVDVLGQLLLAEENLEKDAVHKALLTILRQDVKSSLTGLFKHINESSDESIRQSVLKFVKDKVFPLKSELLKPQQEIERHITDLIKKALQDCTGAEFKMFMNFLQSLTMFGENASAQRVQELMEIMEDQADLNAKFDDSDNDQIDRVLACLHMAIPFFTRGASNGKFFNYVKKHILPVFDKLNEGNRLDLLKKLALASPYTTPGDARHFLPSILQLLKKHVVRCKTGEKFNFAYTECLLYTFHQLASKAPNSTNSLCGYNIVTGQPSDRLGEDFSENYKDLSEKLSTVENLTRATLKKLNQEMSQHDKAMAGAKDDASKADVKMKKENTFRCLRACNNILAMTQSLYPKVPTFIGNNNKISLSWKENKKIAGTSATTASASASGRKRLASESNARDGTDNPSKRQLVMETAPACPFVNRALSSLFRGGGGGGGGGRGRAGGRGFGRGRERERYSRRGNRRGY